MTHRHLNTSSWTTATVDSALERGDLKDWRELFAAVRASPQLADLVLRVARQRDLGGSSMLAIALAERAQSGLSESRRPQIENSEGE